MSIIKNFAFTKHVKIVLGLLVGVIVFSAGGMWWLVQNRAPESPAVMPAGVPAVVQSSEVIDTDKLVAGDPNDPAAAGIPLPRSLEIEEVQEHASPTDCHTIIRGGVYNITSFLEQHPEGKMNTENTCGMDSTVLFESQYGGLPAEEEQLKNLFVGLLVKN